jgi:hypothetical protein
MAGWNADKFLEALGIRHAEGIDLSTRGLAWDLTDLRLQAFEHTPPGPAP